MNTKTLFQNLKSFCSYIVRIALFKLKKMGKKCALSSRKYGTMVDSILAVAPTLKRKLSDSSIAIDKVSNN